MYELCKSLMSTHSLKLQNIHRHIKERKTHHRDAPIRRHNEKTNALQANFIVGDYVLVEKRIDNVGDKLRMKWLGKQ